MWGIKVRLNTNHTVERRSTCNAFRFQACHYAPDSRSQLASTAPVVVFRSEQSMMQPDTIPPLSTCTCCFDLVLCPYRLQDVGRLSGCPFASQVLLPYLKAKVDKLYGEYAPRTVLGLAVARATTSQQQVREMGTPCKDCFLLAHFFVNSTLHAKVCTVRSTVKVCAACCGCKYGISLRITQQGASVGPPRNLGQQFFRHIVVGNVPISGEVHKYSQPSFTVGIL